MSPARRGRILLLVPDLSGNGTITAWHFRGALERAGYEVVLAGPASGELWTPLADELRGALRLGRPGLRVPLPRIAAWPDGPDLVYAFKAHPSSLGPARRMARRHGVPLALHLDDWDAGFLIGHPVLRRIAWGLKDPFNPDGEAWLRLYERRARRCDVLTVSTTALQRRFGGTVVRQGVDTRALGPESHPRAEARRRLGIGPDEPMVLFLGTPRGHKGVDTLAALDGVEGIWVVGLTPEGARALGLGDSELERLHVVPPVSFEESAWYMAACDVFVAPQRDTAFAAHQVPAKILQAMALGVPVVTTRVGDAEELVGGDPAAGAVVAPDDAQALRAAILRLMDPNAARAAGREARRRAETSYGWDAMASTLARLLDPHLPGGDRASGLDFRSPGA